MELPKYVQICIDALERAGFAAYCVGGCVRDACLGLDPHDFDLCTSALPDQTEAVFSGYHLVLAGKKHGTVTVISDGMPVEITTFRTEGAYLDNRHPDWVRFVPNVEEDLARRDFTINAMAWSPYRDFADPFGGREDLKNGVLQAVGDPEARFREDSLRILRGARFAAKYHLSVEENTKNAMFSLAPLMDNLARERVFEELCKLLLSAAAEDLLTFAPVIAQAVPELAPMIGFDQRSPHHAYDLFTHTARVTAGVPAELHLRWAGLLHDVGKIPCFTLDENGRGHFYGHAKASAQMADEILHRLKSPAALREQVVELVGLHMTKFELEKKTVRRWLGKLGPETLNALLTLQEADMGSKGIENAEEMEQFSQLRAMIQEIQAEKACLTLKDLTVSGRDLIAIGFAPGKEIGACLQHLLDLVLDEKISNEKEALLCAAEHFKEN